MWVKAAALRIGRRWSWRSDVARRGNFSFVGGAPRRIPAPPLALSQLLPSSTIESDQTSGFRASNIRSHSCSCSNIAVFKPSPPRQQRSALDSRGRAPELHRGGPPSFQLCSALSATLPARLDLRTPTHSFAFATAIHHGSLSGGALRRVCQRQHHRRQSQSAYRPATQCRQSHVSSHCCRVNRLHLW